MAYSVGFLCGVDIDNAFWFPSIVGNALLCRKDEKTYYIGSFPEEMYNAEPLFSGVVLHEEQLICIPLDACNIAIYDMKENVFRTLPWKSRFDGKQVSIAITIKKDKKLFLFPHNYNSIIKIDLSNWEIIEIPGLLDEISKWVIDEEDQCFGYGESKYAQIGNRIYIGVEKARAIFEFNIETENYVIHEVGEHGYSATVRVGDKIWLAPRRDGCITVWNPMNGEVQLFNNFPDGFKSMSYIGGFHYGEHVWFFPVGTNMVLKVNIYSGEMEEVKGFSPIYNARFTKTSVSRVLFLFCRKIGCNYVMCAGKKARIITYSPETDIIQSYYWECPEEYTAEYKKDLKKHSIQWRMHIRNKSIPPFICENSRVTLGEWLWDVSIQD